MNERDDPQRESEPDAVPEFKPDSGWLIAFYRECGREVTLSYATLNQMKNWAMLAVAAAISGLAFGANAASYPTTGMLLGVVVVYSLVLRFFIRAILCYINLGRWNKLQADCVALKIVPRDDSRGGIIDTRPPEQRLRADIQHYYHGWLSVYDRGTQIRQVLKLGFALLFSLPVTFVLWGLFELWGSSVARGIGMFALGHTFIELNDFLRSGFFDDVAAHERRKNRGKVREVFPVPTSGNTYVVAWMLVVLLSVTVAAWPWLAAGFLLDLPSWMARP